MLFAAFDPEQAFFRSLFKTPWPGDPRVNIPEDKGKAKAYQVRQVLLAIDKLRAMEAEKQMEPEDED
jgi:hypothetical protein